MATLKYWLLFSLFSSFIFSEEKIIQSTLQETNLSDNKKNNVCDVGDKFCDRPNLNNFCSFLSEKSYELEDKIAVTKLLISKPNSTSVIAKRLQVLRTCGVSNETKAFIVAFSYVEATGAKKIFLEKWLLTLKKREATEAVDLLKLLMGGIDDVSSQTDAKIPLARIIQLRIFLIDMASKLIQKGLLPQDSDVENFFRKSSFDFLLTGKGNHIEPLTSGHVESYIKDKKISLSILENACTHWYYVGQESQCTKEVSRLVPSIKNSNRENLTRARILFFQNKVDEAIKLMNENIERGLKDNSDNFLAWGYYGLSNYMPFLGKVDDGKKALLEFKKIMEIKNLGWLGAIIFTREQSHSFDKGEYEKSLEFGNMAIEFLKNKVNGKTSEMAWAKYFRLMALYKLRKVKEFNTEMKELLNYVSDMPSMQFLVHYSKIMAQALKIEDNSSKHKAIDFNKNDPEYLRLLKAI